MVGELVQRGRIGWNADLGQGERGTDQTQKVGVALDALLGTNWAIWLLQTR